MTKRRKKTKIFLIEKYYQLLGTKLDWDEQKILTLCYATRMELDELAALLRMSETALKGYMRRGISKQLSLLLYQIAVSKGFYAPHPLPEKSK
jgi:hypothetical protein